MPDEIYYDLTSIDWYRRGEPLMRGRTAYTPRGAPVSVPLSELEKAGRYQGVDFYVRGSDSAPHRILYVPVSPTYWLRFVRPGNEARSS